MRTIFLLDRDDLAALRRGDPFDIQTGTGQTVTLQMATTNGRAAPKADAESPTRPYTAGFKALVLADYRKGQKAGRKASDTARKFKVTVDQVYRWAR